METDVNMGNRLFLHLEDNRIAQKLLARTLQCFGECRGFVSIKEAEAFIKKQPQIDAFFVDYTVSDGIGLCFVKRVRGMAQYNHIPVILLTSTLTNEIAYKAMKSGVNISISKLTSPSMLRRILARQVKRPYVKLVQRDLYEVWCAVWEKEGFYYQYCPELDEKVSAGTPEDAEKQMRERLEQLIYREGIYPDSILNVEGYAHRFQLNPTED